MMDFQLSVNKLCESILLCHIYLFLLFKKITVKRIPKINKSLKLVMSSFLKENVSSKQGHSVYKRCKQIILSLC